MNVIPNYYTQIDMLGTIATVESLQFPVERQRGGQQMGPQYTKSAAWNIDRSAASGMGVRNLHA